MYVGDMHTLAHYIFTATGHPLSAKTEVPYFFKAFKSLFDFTSSSRIGNGIFEDNNLFRRIEREIPKNWKEEEHFHEINKYAEEQFISTE